MRVALVLGSASTVWAEAQEAGKLGRLHGGVAANDAGVVWPYRLDAWVTYHAEHVGRFVQQRQARGLPDHGRIVIHPSGVTATHRLSAYVTDVFDGFFPGQTASGSSGLFALKVALMDLGFDRAVLCGIPLDGNGGHLRSDQTGWANADAYQAGWLEALPHIRDRARSLGGWTRDLLGAPTREWMAGE